MDKFPIGFMSYVRFDDEHENGRLTEFCKRLSGEVSFQTGEQFDIFQDRQDIKWGHQWKHRIDECIDAGTFLIPIITPRFFRSKRCRHELEHFLARESQLGRNDLILPLYYVNCSILNDACKRNDDPLAKLISERNYFDWRELRFEPLSSPQSAKMVAKLAMQIAEAIDTRIPEPERNPCPLAALPGVQPGKAVFGPAAAPARKGDVRRSPDPMPSDEPESEIQKIIDGAFHRGDRAVVSNGVVWLTQGGRGVLEEYDWPENANGEWKTYSDCIPQRIRKHDQE